MIYFAAATAVLLDLKSAAVLVEHTEARITHPAFIAFFPDDLIVVVIINRVGGSSAFSVDFASDQLAVFEIAPAVDPAVPVRRLFLPHDFARLERVIVDPQVWNA